jgi:hypothetical protein
VVIEQDIQYRSYRVFSRNGRNFHAWKAGKYPFPCYRVARDNDDIVNTITHHYCYGTGGYDNSPLEEVLIRPLVGEHSRLKSIGSGVWFGLVCCRSRAFVPACDRRWSRSCRGPRHVSARARDLASTGMNFWLIAERQGNFERNLAGAEFHSRWCFGFR